MEMLLLNKLDTSNTLCPIPVIRTQEFVTKLSVGDILEITATDPGALNDIPAWCRVHGHQVLGSSQNGRDIIIEIKIGASD